MQKPKKDKTKPNVVNVKLDDKAKAKVELIAYLQGKSKQDLCKDAILEYLNKFDENTLKKELDKKLKESL